MIITYLGRKIWWGGKVNYSAVPISKTQAPSYIPVGPARLKTLEQRRLFNALRKLRKLRSLGLMVKDFRLYSTDSLVTRSAYIFAHLEELLKNSPLNTATQLVIETFLVNQGEFLITNKKYADVYVNLLNDPIKLFCMDKREELMPYVMKLIRSLLLLETNFKESSSLKKKYDYYTGKVMPYSCWRSSYSSI